MGLGIFFNIYIYILEIFFKKVQIRDSKCKVHFISLLLTGIIKWFRKLSHFYVGFGENNLWKKKNLYYYYINRRMERISTDKENFSFLSWFLGKGFMEKVKTLLLY